MASRPADQVQSRRASAGGTPGGSAARQDRGHGRTAPACRALLPSPRSARAPGKAVSGRDDQGRVHARRVGVAGRDRAIDLIVAGSVAVDSGGARLGKGGGYSDLEFALARAVGVVDETTPIVTTVHELQVVDDTIPMTAHDVPLDVVVRSEERRVGKEGRCERWS